jgi:hypothetical protein
MTYQTGQPREVIVLCDEVWGDRVVYADGKAQACLHQIGDLGREATQLLTDGNGPCYEVNIAAYDDQGYEQPGRGGKMLWAPNAPGCTAGICWGATSDWYDASDPDDAVAQSQAVI